MIAPNDIVSPPTDGYETEKGYDRRVKFAVNAVNAVKAKNSINAKFAGTATNVSFIQLRIASQLSAMKYFLAHSPKQDTKFS